MNAQTWIVAAGVGVLTAVGFVVAGPLTPPPGPVAETSPSLADLRTQIAGASGGGDLADALYADTSSSPGSAADGKPLPLDTSLTRTRILLSVPGVGAFNFTIADLARSVERVPFTSGQGDTINISGDPSYDVTLIRPLPPDDERIDQWFQDGVSPSGTYKFEGLLVWSNGSTLLRVWTLEGAFITDIDVRIVDGEAVEQIRLSADSIVFTPIPG